MIYLATRIFHICVPTSDTTHCGATMRRFLRTQAGNSNESNSNEPNVCARVCLQRRNATEFACTTVACRLWKRYKLLCVIYMVPGAE